MEERNILAINKFSKGEYEAILETNFIFNDTHVYSNGENIIFKSIKTVDHIDSSHEINRYIRPDVITIQGILCYFTGYPFTIYENVNSCTDIIEPTEKHEIGETKLLINGTDYSLELQKLLSKLINKSERSFIITVLDRWRKAQFMVRESDINTFHDESLLTYFHILELIASQYYDNFKSDAVQKINSFISSYVDDILLLRGNSAEDAKNSKVKILKEILLTDSVSISTKINYFLKQHNLLDNKTYTYVSKLKDIRNAIAHGRIVFRDKLLWPLPPFFFLTNDSHLRIEEAAIFTARSIDLILGTDVWKEHWESIHQYLYPPPESIRKFILEKPRVSSEDFFNGSYYDVTPLAIIDYFINNPKKVTIDRLGEIFAIIFEEVEANEENSFEMFIAAIVVADSEIPRISAQAKEIVEFIVSNCLHGFSNIKDALRYLNYFGINPVWFREWIENR
jgi:hypothetical protein